MLVASGAACSPEPSHGGTAAPLRASTAPLPDTTFGALVARLSEPGGYFDTDNLISNESSYLHPMGALERSGLRGGAYLGVGPDQNFSYMAALRPEIAFLVDIRRDNLIQHLLFKALFGMARNRLEYLALLYARPLPDDLAAWDERPLPELIAWIDEHPAGPQDGAAVRARVAEQVRSFGVPLDGESLATLDRFQREFITSGLDLRFRSYGRRPRFFYPTHRDLLLERDLDGAPASYLVEERDFQWLKALQEENRVIPVVGNLAGRQALRAIGAEVRRLGLEITAFYTSNVEFYLWSDGSFVDFAETMATLPLAEDGLLIRSYFGGGGIDDPVLNPVAGYYSVQLLQPFRAFAEAARDGGFRGYRDLVTRSALTLESSAPR
ncbi:MAG: hypothetical protein KC645_03275 [Gemmatimonadetes bacterium]|nr:hypothetical protein [Gemmatimonadota bacterium]